MIRLYSDAICYLKDFAGVSLLHREDGPAIEWTNGNKEWYFKGKNYRADGPAIIFGMSFLRAAAAEKQLRRV